MTSTVSTLADLRQGQEIPPLDVTLDRADLVKYSGASDDYTYVHWDHPKMIGLGFPDVVVHGWLTFAHMCRAVTDWVPREIADIAAFAVRYRKPTFPGTFQCGGRVIAVRRETGRDEVDLELWSKSADGDINTSATMTLVRAG